MSQPSSAVLAAQQKLQQKRATLRTKERDLVSQIPRRQTAVSQLPPHLGWGSHALSTHLRKNKPVLPPVVEDPHSFNPQPCHTPHPPPASSQVKHFPTLGLQAIRQQLVPHYQVWLACRLLDKAGRGWLMVKDVRQQLTAADEALRLFGWRRLRQVLHQGNGRFWQWDRHEGRLWLHGVAKLAASLDSPKMSGLPVYVPSNALTEGIATFKAHLYAAWHSGRRANKPVSRQTLRKLTAVPERTQRHYEKVTHVRVKANLAIGATYTPENLEQQSWQRGGAVFKFLDKNGRFGPKQKTYLAWQLPNSYAGPHQQAPRGRQRRINHQLTDLVHQGAQGNGKSKIERTYFDHGKEAAQAEAPVSYWPEGDCRGFSLWHVLECRDWRLEINNH